MLRVHDGVAADAGAQLTDFVWGVATSAYQIEGAWDDDGKAPSVWDTVLGDAGHVACDHYHRWEEDVALLAELGVTSYRFSISWPRVQTSPTAWSQRGLDWYSRLVDALLDRGIEPMVTLYHWDHPQWVEELGGWQSADTASRLADYASRVVDALGDRVPRWNTLNEPQSVLVGHILGFSRPAGPLGERGLDIVPNLVGAHELCVDVLRRTTGEVGIALNLTGFYGDDPSLVERATAMEDRLFLDPVLTGPPIDFLGVNWYSPARVVAAQPAGPDASTLERLFAGLADVFGYSRMSDPPTNMLGGTLRPAALGELLTWLGATYGDALPAIHITENGLATDDDAQRIEYLRACTDVALADPRVRGYFVWSFLDNLEWGLGYRPRFGLVHVDRDTLERTPKDSFFWYRDRIKSA